MTNRDLLKEAIADAKAVKEVAIANAKAALEEAFTPHLQSMFEKQITEMEHEKEDSLEEDFNLEELLKELEEAELEEVGFGKGSTAGDEGFSTMGEKALDEAEDDDADTKDVPEKSDKADDDAEIDIDLDNLTPEAMEKLESFIEEVVDELIAAGQIEGGEEKTDEPETEETPEDTDTMTNPEELSEIMGTDAVQMAQELGLDYETVKGMALAAGMAVPALIAAIGAGGPAVVKFFKEKIKGKKASKTAELSEIMGTDAVQMAQDLGMDYETVKQLALAVGMSIPALIAAIGAGGPSIVKFFKEKLGGKKAVKAETSMDAEKAEMEKELTEARRTIRTLKRELNEINLLNSKLLFTNKIFKAKNLTEAQKLHVLAAFDKAESVKETKLVYETLKEGITKVETKKTFIQESKSFASKSVGTSPKQPVVKVDPMVERFQKLAGLK